MMTKKASINNLFSFEIVVLLVCALMIFAGCQTNALDTDIARVSEITELFDDVPLHPSKAQIDWYNKTDGYAASIARTYQTDAAFDEVREFYLEQLPRQGWQFVEERELKDRGRIKDERVLDFQKGEFVLSIQFAGDRRADLGWDYAVRIGFPEDNKEKV